MAEAFGFGTPFAEQLEFFRRKLNLPTEQWDDIKRSANDRAFVVAGAGKADLLQDLRAAMDSPMASGGGLQEFRQQFRGVLAKTGWTGWTGEGSAAGQAWRTRIIYQTNMATSYAAGRRRQMTEPDFAAERPFWRYEHFDGVKHPRPQHQAWDGLTLPIEHEFWKTHFAPNGWGCRCEIHPVRRPRAGDPTEPPEGWARLDPKTGAPVGIDRGFDYAPGAEEATPLADLLGQKLIDLDAPLGAAMWQALAPAIALERQQAWWATLDTWLGSKPQGRTATVGALSPELLRSLGAVPGPAPPTAAIAVTDRVVIGAKQLRHEAAQNGLSEAEWRALPTLLDRPAGVYRDNRSGHLIFVADGAGPTKAAVEFVTESSGGVRANLVVSAFRVSDLDIAGAVKGGQWKTLAVPGA